MFNLFGRKSSKPKNPDLAPNKAEQEPVENGPPRYNGAAPKERHDQIEYAFTSGGVDYFRFNSEVNIPFQRAIAARDILTEELWQINPDFLRGWNEALLKIVISEQMKNDKKIYEIGILASRLKEQMQLSFSLVRQLRLASVVYFDEYENPLDYQHPYNEKKIRFWMNNNDVPGFFLNLLDYQSLPSLKEYQQNFPNYLQAETIQKIADLKHIISHTSSQKGEEDLLKLLDSQMAMLSDINSWSKGQFTNIT